jgi:hypothetical protein
MDSKKPKQPFGRRINNWLEEGAGEIFKDGKWRFWWLALIGFQILNALLTAIIFGSAGNLHQFMGAILLGVGALLGWLGVGFLHYSDSPRLARGVSFLDSATLLFVVGHFCFLLWVYGHVGTLRSAEADFKAQAKDYNDKAGQIQDGNARIAEALRGAAEADRQRAKIENDTAYQQRKAAEAGGFIPTRRDRPSSTAASLSTSPIELQKPAAPPEESSAAFLARWDWWVRMTNFGELLLAAVTLIYIRTQSAKFNAGAGNGQRGPTYIGGGRPVEGFARGSQGRHDPKEQSDQG